jgi:hypothetical protein
LFQRTLQTLNIHFLRKMDPRGDILTQAFSVMMGRSEPEFRESLEGIGVKLMGDDQVEVFVSRNRYGEPNAAILGYLAGCIEAAGGRGDDVPYPVDRDGNKYEGECENEYDRERSYVLGDR